MNILNTQIDIALSYGGQVNLHQVIEWFKATGRTAAVVGQQAATLDAHTKPDSLDVFARSFARHPNTKQADARFVSALVATGHFERTTIICQNSSRRCKAIRLIH